MDNYLMFFGQHPWLCALFLFCSYYLFHNLLIILPCRLLRCFVMHKHGYPPAHCDAGGDLKQEKNP